MKCNRQQKRQTSNPFRQGLRWFILVSYSIKMVVVSSSFVDRDTPEAFYTTKAYTEGDNRDYELVCFLIPFSTKKNWMAAELFSSFRF
jgi:hypothetical protein